METFKCMITFRNGIHIDVLLSERFYNELTEAIRIKRSDTWVIKGRVYRTYEFQSIERNE